MKILEKIKDFRRDLKYFFIHGWQMRKIRHWDYTHFFMALESHFTNMEKSFKWSEQHHAHVGIERNLRTLLICKNLSRRLANDSYENRYSERSREQANKWWASRVEVVCGDVVKMTWPEGDKGTCYTTLSFKMEEHQRQTDVELLCKLIRTQISKMWW